MAHEEWWKRVFSKLSEMGKEFGKVAAEVGKELGEKADLSKELAAVELQLAQFNHKKKEWVVKLGEKVYTFAKGGKSDILELICGEELAELRKLDEKLDELSRKKQLLLQALKQRKEKEKEIKEGAVAENEKSENSPSDPVGGGSDRNLSENTEETEFGNSKGNV